MALTKVSGRQEVIAAVLPFAFADLAGLSGVYNAAIDVPNKATVLSARIAMDVAFNSATSDTFSIGRKVGAAAALPVAYSAAAAIAAGAQQNGVMTGEKFTSPGSVGLTWTGVGAVPTAGSGRMIVEYVVEGRAGFSQG